MNRKLIIGMVFVGLLAGNAWAALEATRLGDIQVELNGYYRVRGELFSFSEEGWHSTDWLDHRIRLETNFLFTDKIALKMEFGALEGVVWGTNESGQILSQVATDHAIKVPFLSNTQPQAVDNFRVKRAFLEVKTSLGMLRVGRMGSHFGLGLLSNDGNHLEGNAGDTFDRFLFLTKPAGETRNFYTAAIFSKIAEGDTSVKWDDVEEYVLVPFWTSDLATREKYIGAYLLYRHQSEGNSLTSKSNAYLMDVYLAWKWSNFTIQAEMLYGQAKLDLNLPTQNPLTGADVVIPFKDVSGGAFNFAIHGTWETEKYWAGFKTGGQTGADEDHIQISDVLGYFGTGTTKPDRSYTMAVDQDYVFDLIMFREALAAITARTPLPFDDSKGSLWNAYFFRAHGGYKMFDERLTMGLALQYGSIINTACLKTSVGGRVLEPDSALGFEVDLEVYYTFMDRFKVGLLAGYLAPGAFFEDMKEIMAPTGPYGTLGVTPFTDEAIYTIQTRFFLLI
jgi:hypothetical protein